MSAHILIRKKVEAEKLPLGHVDRKKTEKAVAKEYENAHKIERTWRKRFKQRYFDTPEQALEFVNAICRSLGQCLVKRVVVNCSEVIVGAEAHCDRSKREICFKWRTISLTTLIHELAHHFGPMGHGNEFCWTLDFLFRQAYTLQTGKEPKKDW